MDVHGRVQAAFAAVPRREFLPRGSRADESVDAPIQIGHGQTNSQPRTVAVMLELLQVLPGQRVLDVGSGSAWTTALLAELTGPEGHVVGVEIVPALATWGAENLARTAYHWARIRAAEAGVLGAPELGPFDRILVSAEGPSVPGQLVDQLDQDGRMVLPVNGTMLLVERAPDGLRTTEHGSYRFVPLR